MNTGRTGATRVLRLDECAEVLPGFSVRGRMEHDPAGTHQLVLSRHLTDGVPYVYEPTHELRIRPSGDVRKYQITRGDLLFMSRGTRNLAWEISEVPKLTLAPVSFYVIRPSGGMNPGYLAWYLNQPAAQNAIEQIRTGAGTPIVQRKAFKEIEILVPASETQSQVAQLAGLLAQERHLLSNLTAAVNRLHTAIGRQVIDHLRSGAITERHQ